MTSGDESEEMVIEGIDSTVDDLDASNGAIGLGVLLERWTAAGLLLCRANEKFFRSAVAQAEEVALNLCAAADDSD
jgi:hypothetical protein